MFIEMNSRNQETAGGKISRMGRWLVLAVAASLAPLASAADSVLKQTSFAALPGQKTEIRFSFDVPPPAPKIYMIESPPRLVMDFFGVTNEQAQRMLSVESGVVSTLNFAEAQGRLRVVANLTEAASYSTSADGNNLYVQLGDARMGSGKAAQAAPADRALAASNSASVMSDQTRVQSIDFERIDGGTGRVVINMSDDEAGLDIIEEGNNIVVNLLGASLAKELENRTDVQVFATPVMYVDAMAAGGNTAILIKPSAEPYDYMAYQTGNQLVLDFKPMTDQELANRKADLFPYSGEEIDLNFQNVELRSVLQIIAEVAEKNLVVGDEVGGNVTLRLKNVPWDQALDIILQTNGLDKRIVGNVMLIGGASQIAERERQELEAQEQVKNLAPLMTEYIQVDYRKASEMKGYVENAGLVSERGFILADDQTNVMMVRETSAAIEEIRRTLGRFDVETAQIMVEARIVSADESFTKNLGVNWGLFKQTVTSSGVGLGLGATTAIGGAIPRALPGDALGVDLGAAGPAVAVGFLANSLLLTAELQALETSGNGEVISQPKVITTNGTSATISSGTTLLVPQIVDGQQDTVEIDVALSLQVTPQLTPNDRVALQLNITQDSLNVAGDIATNNLSTNVVVKDGDTIVLGGVFRTNSQDTINKVPLLGDLPVVGAAFRNTQRSDSKEELLIFITPKLIREALTSR